jgi:putative transposase
VQGLEGIQEERLLRLEGSPALKERARDNIALTKKIREIHTRSRRTYAYPRVDAELKAIGVRCSRKRVARVMRKEGLQGCLRGRGRKRTTRRDPAAMAAPDVVERNFCGVAPNKIWTADITYLRTDEGFLWLSVFGLHSRCLLSQSGGLVDGL